MIDEHPDVPPADRATPRQRPQTAVSYEHSTNLPALLDRIGAALVVSTYQAGKVFTIGAHESTFVTPPRGFWRTTDFTPSPHHFMRVASALLPLSRPIVVSF
jgi:hypothetical protein